MQEAGEVGFLVLFQGLFDSAEFGWVCGREYAETRELSLEFLPDDDSLRKIKGFLEGCSEFFIKQGECFRGLRAGDTLSFSEVF